MHLETNLDRHLPQLRADSASLKFSRFGPAAHRLGLCQKPWKRGEEAGIEKGRVQGGRANLRALLEERFGTLPNGLIQRIEACEDFERLQAALRQTSRLEKLEDIQL